ncbi:MAG: hypothetical protein WC864_09705 [Ilumatobacteraceae bacterium]
MDVLLDHEMVDHHDCAVDDHRPDVADLMEIDHREPWVDDSNLGDHLDFSPGVRRDRGMAYLNSDGHLDHGLGDLPDRGMDEPSLADRRDYARVDQTDRGLGDPNVDVLHDHETVVRLYRGMDEPNLDGQSLTDHRGFLRVDHRLGEDDLRPGANRLYAGDVDRDLEEAFTVF